MFELLSVESIVIYAILYGITMKIADLLNEHGLKMFKGSAIIFGILWGVFGALLILSNNIIGNIILAMNIAFIIRNRLDCINHQIASSIILIAFLITSHFELNIFLPFYAIFLIFGSLKDYIDDKKKGKGILFILNESMFYYPIPTFIYCLLYGNWIVFFAFLFYTLAYDITKYVYKKKGYK